MRRLDSSFSCKTFVTVASSQNFRLKRRYKTSSRVSGCKGICATWDKYRLTSSACGGIQPRFSYVGSTLARFSSKTASANPRVLDAGGFAWTWGALRKRVISFFSTIDSSFSRPFCTLTMPFSKSGSVITSAPTERCLTQDPSSLNSSSNLSKRNRASRMLTLWSFLLTDRNFSRSLNREVTLARSGTMGRRSTRAAFPARYSITFWYCCNITNAFDHRAVLFSDAGQSIFRI